MQVEVDMLQEGRPAKLTHAEVEALLNALGSDSRKVVQLALQAKKAREPRYTLPQIANLSLVVCDDAYIQQLNKETRGKDYATDVLSFELPDEEGVVLPIKLLGDVVISLDTARKQAEERG
jgi:ssRNA-specific RNase YbeY (16S rRNA maturation enzyme)